MDDIKQLVQSFKEKTMFLLTCLQEENYEKLNETLRERQKIIDLFEQKSNHFSKDEITREFENADIDFIEMNKKVEEDIISRMRDLKGKLQIINNAKNLNKKYHQGFSGNPMFFNKKI